MRSRLEARWGVFLDAVGLKDQWRYEHQGFELTDGSKYLPDFTVKGIGWLEIKSEMATPDEAWKLREVVMGTETPGFLLQGSIPDPEGIYAGGTGPELEITALFVTGNEDFSYWVCVCPICGKVGVEYCSRADRIYGGSIHYELQGKDRGHNGDHPRIVEAAMMARGARFEHGEIPRIL